MAEADGIVLLTSSLSNVEEIIDQDLDLVVAVVEDDHRPLQTLAGAHPELQFLLVGPDDQRIAGSNVIQIGGPGSRHDQVAFLAGALAGWTTETLVVAVAADPATPVGAKYLNGFLHGVRYTCGECRVESADWPSTATSTDAGELAETWAQRSVDTAFVPSGPGSTALAVELAGHGVWLLASGQELRGAVSSEALAARLVANVAFRPDILLNELVPALLAGSRPESPIPYQAASGSIAIQLLHESRVSPAVQARLDETLVLLASGALDTGVDALTGEAVERVTPLPRRSTRDRVGPPHSFLTVTWRHP